jgi:ubiquinone/menaquinone biosynthesis C-methylase UbiE
MIDKNGVLPSLASRTSAILELGCGQRKRSADWIGIDSIDYPQVDIVGDVAEVLKDIPNSSIDEIHAFHFLEHVADVPALLLDIGRVLKLGGRLHVVVPHFSNPYYYSDPTHKSFWGLYTFSYYARSAMFRRKVPTYVQDVRFEIQNVRLNFKSSPPFYIRHAFKKAAGALFNLNTFMREMYEENFCYLIPCYEVEYHLIKVAD